MRTNNFSLSGNIIDLENERIYQGTVFVENGHINQKQAIYTSGPD